MTITHNFPFTSGLMQFLYTQDACVKSISEKIHEFSFRVIRVSRAFKVALYKLCFDRETSNLRESYWLFLDIACVSLSEEMSISLRSGEHVDLPSQQRRLRHLRSVSARNLSLSDNHCTLLDAYFTLHVPGCKNGE
jgi:hypothetical protein